jgi:threonine dehydratase
MCYDDALAASEKWAVESGGLAVHACDQVETQLGQRSVAWKVEEQAPRMNTLLVAVEAAD